MLSGNGAMNQTMQNQEVYGDYNGYMPNQFPQNEQSFGGAV